MNTDTPKDGQPKLSSDYDELFERIRGRREQILDQQGVLSDSSELIREDRERPT